MKNVQLIKLKGTVYKNNIMLSSLSSLYHVNTCMNRLLTALKQYLRTRMIRMSGSSSSRPRIDVALVISPFEGTKDELGNVGCMALFLCKSR